LGRPAGRSGFVVSELDSPMELKLYDTLTRGKRVFRPLDPQNVRMYVCGPTVYDFAHIGNARPVIVFDVLFRLLRHIYGADHVTYVRNITDVDDKINARAAEEYPDLPLNEAIRKVTEKTDQQFHEDVAALGCLAPTYEPRATEHIGEMKTLIERLIASGNAYVAEDNVLFSVPSMPDYGQLSKRPLDEMIAGARVEVAAYKKDPRDFVLWKPSKPGEPAWPSPAGIKAPGRPGWHIECSAMAWKYLGETFDIHGGGIDLVFPHHEDELAQTRCAFHTPAMANFWMHNGFLQVEGEKMAKSAGNFVTIHELLSGWKGRKWPGQVIRLAMLGTHYRQPIDWTTSTLEEAETVHRDWSEFCQNAPINGEVGDNVLDALSDDLNTPKAIAELHALRKAGDASTLRASLSFLGVGLIVQLSARTQISVSMQAHFTVVKEKAIDAQIEKINSLITSRNAARKTKDFVEADRIRDELAKMGVVLKDSKDRTIWEIPAEFRPSKPPQKPLLVWLKAELYSHAGSIVTRVLLFVSSLLRHE
jgi:cysteinyl-tRNA synthetase